MLSISQTIPSLNNTSVSNLQDGEFGLSRYTNVSTFEHESTDITLFTEDGDRVTISSEVRIASEYTSYRGLLVKDDLYGNFREEKISLESLAEFSISVEGDLSEDELTDIRKAIKTVDKILQKLKSGNIDKALKLAEDTIALDSISGLSASMEVEKSLKMEEHVQASVSYSSPELGDEGSRNYNRLMDKMLSLADRLMDIINNAGVDGSKMLDPFEDYLSGLIKDKQDTNPDLHNSENILKTTAGMLLNRVKEMNHAPHSLK